MSELLADHHAPSMCAVSRREAIRLLAGAVAVAATGTFFPVLAAEGKEEANESISDAIPVRSPAFRSLPNGRTGHLVLFCQRTGDSDLAYDLNPAAARVWNHCLTGEQVAAGVKHTVRDIAGKAGIELAEAEDFVLQMQRSGLVYMAGSNVRIYFEYQGPH